MKEGIKRTNPLGSSKKKVKENSGKHHFEAYAKAGKKDIYLYASDNTKNTYGYSVKGIWDEETGILPDNA